MKKAGTGITVGRRGLSVCAAALAGPPAPPWQRKERWRRTWRILHLHRRHSMSQNLTGHLPPDSLDAILAELRTLSEGQRVLGEGLRVLTEEQRALAGEHRTLAGELRVLTEEQRALAGEHRTLAGELRALTEEHRILAGEQRTLAGELRVLGERMERVETAVDARSRETRPLSERIDRILVEIGDVKAQVVELRGDVRELRRFFLASTATLTRAHQDLEDRVISLEEGRAQ
jgi:chromosome segregation ATPase